MNGIKAIIKKELIESIRKYKLLVMIAIFTLIGIISPIGTKYLGEILTQLLPEGYVLEVREASEMEAYFQFFKNISQIGLIILIFITSGLMADELDKKTIINILTKGIDRRDIIISKFIISLIIWTFSYLISFIVFKYYTSLFWDSNINSLLILYSNLIVFEYGILIIALNILLGIIFKNKILTIVFCLIFTFGQMFIAIFPQISKILPVSLLYQCVYIIEGKTTITDTIITAIITLLCIIFILLFAINLFRKKEIEQ